MASDRRIIYTKQVIKESFLKLLNDTPIEELTVKALCIEADINRATFYRHYKDIYHLFSEVEKSLCSETSAVVVKDVIEINVLDVIYNNQGFYKEFFRSNLLSNIIKESNQYFFEEQLAKAKMKNNFNPITFKYSFDYFVYGVEGLLKDWVNGGCVETPLEFSKILKDIINL